MYQFLSPHGDKFQQESVAYDAIQTSFRPLAGINFNYYEKVC